MKVSDLDRAQEIVRRIASLEKMETYVAQQTGNVGLHIHLGTKSFVYGSVNSIRFAIFVSEEIVRLRKELADLGVTE